MIKAKRIAAFIVCFTMLCCLCAEFAGCDSQNDKIVELENEIDVLKNKIDELEKENKDLSDRTEELEFQTSKKQLYLLREAYNNGFLTHEDLLNIAYYYNGTKGNEDVFPKDFVPQSRDMDYLTDSMQKIIKRSYISTYLLGAKDAVIEGVRVKQYLGVYGGYIALTLDDDYSGIAGECDIIDNVFFSRPDVLIWG